MTTISLVWAQTNDGTIAVNNQIPWHQKDDMLLFKQATLNKVIVMGRHTMESFNGRPLPKRLNLVLTHDESLEVPEGFQKVHSVEEAINVAKAANLDLAVIGGKPIYESFMPVADKLVVTYLDTDLTGDVKMPKVDKTVWKGIPIAQGTHNEANDYDYEALEYELRD